MRETDREGETMREIDINREREREVISERKGGRER